MSPSFDEFEAPAYRVMLLTSVFVKYPLYDNAFNKSLTLATLKHLIWNIPVSFKQILYYVKERKLAKPGITDR